MTEDLINKKDIYFPSYLGTNDNLITLLNRATQILCDWFSKTEKYGPLHFDENFKCLMPDEDGNSTEDLFSEIQSLLNNLFLFVDLYYYFHFQKYISFTNIENRLINRYLI